jgi:CRISPR/Cas system Type II protein with McrA/HNH and RuvC-like nuclease domain
MRYNGFIIRENKMSGKNKVQNNFGPLTFGLDIGIASVGWAVLAPDRIVDLGVRCFDKDGKPNNQTRRGARVSRNRYDMRSWRLKRLVRLFRDAGMLSNDEIRQLFSDSHPKKQSLTSPWELRSKGLTQKNAPLTPQEWAQVIYHIVKHRGFKFFSKSEDPRDAAASADGETPAETAKTQEQKERGELKNGLEFTTGLLKKYPQFVTIGNAAYHLANAKQDNNGIYRSPSGERLETEHCEEFQESFRNKDKSYRHAFHRDDLRDELAKLFDAQQQWGNPYTDLILPDSANLLQKVQIGSQERDVSPTFRDQIFALLELQHPPIYMAQMDALIGKCELEKNELRASKHSFTNERRTWLETLNNLRIKRSGSKEEALSDPEREALINLPYTQGKVTFKQVREKLREKTGFPAHWREASFTKASYRNKRKDDGSWINIIAADGKKTLLGKYGEDKIRKEANKKLKVRLETGTMTFAELRSLYQVKNGEIFERQQKEEQIILALLEDQYPIPFGALDNKEAFIKILPAKSKSAAKLSNKAMKALAALRNSKPDATLADLRAAIEGVEQVEPGWQFEYGKKSTASIRLEDETTTNVPIEYEDAQQAEEETLIELKGWHALRRALETSQPEWWNELQTAWRDAQSADASLKAAAQASAEKLDTIAEVLTKAQTDADVASGLGVLGLTPDKIEALKAVRFKQYRNLSLKALRKILPYLEQTKSYSEACTMAGYKAITFQRTRHLPPLETYLYERMRHGEKTGYKELRYKDLTNPVVARAFNQARLVLNALIDRYDQSPAYVHVELARDIAKPKFGHRSEVTGKYIQGRDDIKKKQEENRNKRASARNIFIERYNINDPDDWQLLKERLYREQQCHCPYTLKKLDLDQVVSDENYAQIDHIWPRSRTFDNSMENLVLVHADANQDKGNDIPYDFIRRKYGDEHWRRVTAHVLDCKEMSDNKQKRLLATELDADEFLARNLVDTRYATRLFARMVRDRLLFDGQTEDKIGDIDPSESGKSRLEKFHRTRVRTPQGGVVNFLRRRWLGDIKDRDAGDKHHAMDACIIAACTPELIHRVNSWFSNQEKVPNRFKKRDDGTYTDKGTREIISKDKARERGLYLPAPWDEVSPGKFRHEFLEKYESVFVSRAINKKRNGELHDANPMRLRYYPVRLLDLIPEMLDDKQLPPELPEKRSLLIRAVKQQLLSCDGDANAAFSNGFGTTSPKNKEKIIYTLPLPLISLPEDYFKKAKKQENDSKATENFDKTAKKNFDLAELTLSKLEEKAVGSAFYNRNKRMIEALKAQLEKFNDDAKKAFDEPFYPFGKDCPPIKSIRLPITCSSGIFMRGGMAGLGKILYTEMYKNEGTYWFRARYKAPEEATFGLPTMPKGAQHICNFTKNDFVRIKHPKLVHCYREVGRHKDSLGNTLIYVEEIFKGGVFEGYWDQYQPTPPNERPVIKLHDASPFFQLEDGKTLDKKSLTLIVKPKEKKSKTKSKEEELEYFEFSATPLESPLKFALVSDIKKKVGDAVFIEKLKVGILGLDQEEQS